MIIFNNKEQQHYSNHKTEEVKCQAINAGQHKYVYDLRVLFLISHDISLTHDGCLIMKKGNGLTYSI